MQFIPVFLAQEDEEPQVHPLFTTNLRYRYQTAMLTITPDIR